MNSEEVQVEKRIVYKGSEGKLSLTFSNIRFKPNEFSESADWSVGSIIDVSVHSSSSGLIQLRLTFVRDKREQHAVFEFIGEHNDAALSDRISDRTRFCSRLDAVRAQAAAVASTAKVSATDRPSATLSSTQRAQLRADYLRDNPDRLMLFKHLVPNLVSDTEFWKEEQVALDEYATQRRARSGDIKEPVYLKGLQSSVQSTENGTLNVKITVELRQAIFRKYPHVKRAFEDKVTLKRMSEQEFFKQFITSDLFRRELSVLNADHSDDNARANRFFAEYPSATDMVINWLDQNAEQQQKRRRNALDIDPTADLSSEEANTTTTSQSLMTERAQRQYSLLRELNFFNMDVVDASVSQRRQDSLTSSTEDLQSSYIEKLKQSLIIRELTAPPEPQYNRLTISDPRRQMSQSSDAVPIDSTSSLILKKQIAEWCSESRQRLSAADVNITFGRLCPPAEALRVLVDQSSTACTGSSDRSVSQNARTIQNQSDIASLGCISTKVVGFTARSDTDIPPEVQERLHHFDRACQFQIKRFWECMSLHDYERAQEIDTSLGVLRDHIQKYRDELNASRRHEFSCLFNSVSNKIDTCCDSFKKLAIPHIKRRDAAAK